MSYTYKTPLHVFQLFFEMPGFICAQLKDAKVVRPFHFHYFLYDIVNLVHGSRVLVALAPGLQNSRDHVFGCGFSCATCDSDKCNISDPGTVKSGQAGKSPQYCRMNYLPVDATSNPAGSWPRRECGKLVAVHGAGVRSGRMLHD
jgi:hypothetical protein